MTHPQTRTAGSLLRRGFTLIELLVTISIMAVLMSLILPAVQNSREAARQIQCANRLRNISIAMQVWIAANNRYPAAGAWGGKTVVDKAAPEPHHNWVVELLAYLDRQDLADRWDMDLQMSDSVNATLTETHLNVLVCPSDHTVSGNGDLSYALNGGIGESLYLGVHDCITDPFYSVIDLNGDGQTCQPPGDDESLLSDRAIFFRLGLFFNENYGFRGTPGYQGTHRHHRPATVLDGTSNTLMITENVRTGYDPFHREVNRSTWATADARRNRVYFGHQVCRGNDCSPENVNLNLANSDSQAINSGRNTPEGEAPWPNSNHSGGVNIALADGSVRFLAETTDGAVYMQLFTPQGSRLNGTAFDSGAPN